MLDDQQYAFVQYLGKDLLRYGRNISPNLILWNLNLGSTPGVKVR